jgi:hypothetical protein
LVGSLFASNRLSFIVNFSSATSTSTFGIWIITFLKRLALLQNFASGVIIQLAFSMLDLSQLLVQDHMMLQGHWALVSALNINHFLFGAAYPFSELHVVLEGCR